MYIDQWPQHNMTCWPAGPLTKSHLALFQKSLDSFGYRKILILLYRIKIYYKLLAKISEIDCITYGYSFGHLLWL